MGICHIKLLLSFTAKANYERGKQMQLSAVIWIHFSFLSFVHLYVNNTKTKHLASM